jgi:hypothetical protein
MDYEVWRRLMARRHDAAARVEEHRRITMGKRGPCPRVALREALGLKRHHAPEGSMRDAVERLMSDRLVEPGSLFDDEMEREPR